MNTLSSAIRWLEGPVYALASFMNNHPVTCAVVATFATWAIAVEIDGVLP